MATQRQIEANRLNAQKSTGPCTPEGKAVSSYNALQSGLDAESQFVIGEDRDEFAALQHEYIARFQPFAPEERFQVDTLIRNELTLRRLFRAEARLWEYHSMRADRSEGVPLGAALMAASEVFRRLQRHITLAERSYKDAFAELERLQRAHGPLAVETDVLQIAETERAGAALFLAEPPFHAGPRDVTTAKPARKLAFATHP